MNPTNDASSEPHRTDKVATENTTGNATVPQAIVRPAKVTAKDVVGGSKMWLLTLLCLMIAIGMVWWSIKPAGMKITIQFPEGHGLKAEDVVRFRGIDVGTVEEVKLNSELAGVDVVVDLKKFAQPLAREGTRFWIVRPSLSFSGISGLETAVGHKYIALIPGDAEQKRCFRFEGLPSPPPDALESEGIEIIIRGEERFSVSEGSPLNCRGVDVGRVLSVALSQDTRHVDIRAKVFEKYRKLITTNTRFWATSGFDLDFSLGGGLKMDTESLETIARGGVSLLVVESGGKSVSPGHIFELFPEPEENWLADSRSVRVTDFDLRGAVPMVAVWKQKGLFGTSEKKQTFNGIPYRNGQGNCFVIFPADVAVIPEKSVPDSFHVFSRQTPDRPIPIPTTTTDRFIKAIVPSDFSDQWIEDQDIRNAESFESCLAVRANVNQGSLSFFDYPIESHQLAIKEPGEETENAETSSSPEWFVNRFDGDRGVWHGATLLSSRDGKVLGIVLVENHQATIVRASELLDTN